MSRGNKGSREKNKEKAVFLRERLKLMEQLEQQKLAELTRLNDEIKKNKDLEDKIEKNKKTIENQEGVVSANRRNFRERTFLI
jgi:hypothetical protein